MASLTLPNQDYLVSRLLYDPETGVLRWKTRPEAHFKSYRACAAWNGHFAGKIAGNTISGYTTIRIDNKLYKAHRVIWKMVTGADPDVIDHKDNEGTNNKWENLRSGSQESNGHNRRKWKTSWSGLKGVYLYNGRISSQIRHKGELYRLGYFDTKELAHEAYCEAARRLFGEWWNPG